jgi:hypothetical protein
MVDLSKHECRHGVFKKLDCDKCKEIKLTNKDLADVKDEFVKARDHLIIAASTLQKSELFNSTVKDTKEAIGDLSIAIKALNLV